MDETNEPQRETTASPTDEKPEVSETNTAETETADTSPATGDPPAPDDPDLEIRRHSRTLERPYTDEEKIRIGDELAEALQTAAELEAHKQSVDKDLKAQIAKQDERAHTLASALRKGRREAMIECETVRNYKAGTVVVVRLDTNEEIENRAMTVEERQRGLFGEAGGRSSDPEVIDGIVNPGSFAEEADLEETPDLANPDQTTLEEVVEPIEAIADTARTANRGGTDAEL